MGISARFLVVTALCGAVACEAHACKGTKLLLEDELAELDATWLVSPQEIEDGRVRVTDGAVRLTASGGTAVAMLNGAFRFSDADICVKVRFIDPLSPQNSAVGVVFWNQDYADFYSFQLWANGTTATFRVANGRWEQITRVIGAPSFNVANTADNEIRVLLQGATVTTFLNDVLVARFRAQAPDQPTKFGLRALSFGTLPSAVEFRKLRITTVP